LLNPLIFGLPTLDGQDFEILEADTVGDFGGLPVVEDCSPFETLVETGSCFEPLLWAVFDLGAPSRDDWRPEGFLGSVSGSFDDASSCLRAFLDCC
jgi:hypothetical protein